MSTWGWSECRWHSNGTKITLAWRRRLIGGSGAEGRSYLTKLQRYQFPAWRKNKVTFFYSLIFVGVNLWNTLSAYAIWYDVCQLNFAGYSSIGVGDGEPGGGLQPPPWVWANWHFLGTRGFFGHKRLFLGTLEMPKSCLAAQKLPYCPKYFGQQTIGPPPN